MAARITDPFERAMVAEMPRLQNFARYLAKDADAADDLAQETLARAWAHRESFVLGTNMKAWLFFICRNQFFSGKRRAWRWVQMPVLVDKSGEDASTLADLIPVPPAALDKLQLDDLLQAIAFLPPPQSEAVLLAMEGLSMEEISAEVGVEQGTIKSRLSRAREALQAYFGLNLIEETT